MQIRPLPCSPPQTLCKRKGLPSAPYFFRYIDERLEESTVALAKECKAVCIFVNDVCNEQVQELEGRASVPHGVGPHPARLLTTPSPPYTSPLLTPPLFIPPLEQVIKGLNRLGVSLILLRCGASRATSLTRLVETLSPHLLGRLSDLLIASD